MSSMAVVLAYGDDHDIRRSWQGFLRAHLSIASTAAQVDQRRSRALFCRYHALCADSIPEFVIIFHVVHVLRMTPFFR